ncbi:NTP/NDP exchange transporter [Candidatus Palauibacter sp.]|uniref:NTP/NDP exchange transporter n=1 Tax=Candidatus Palauibacter sp. TaxID=3101350 RepID=UPI003B5A7449
MASLQEVNGSFARRVLNMRRGEFGLAMMSALFFFLVLCGYFFLRPVREAMGVARGMDELRWLFAVTSLASLFAVLVFGGVVARTNRRRFIPIAYLFVIACLIGFATLLIQDVRAGGGLIGTDAETGLARGVGYTFYVWLSVINLFSTSVFWAFMVDVFNVDQGKRMFPFIGIGGTLGAFLGGRGANFVSGLTESPYLPAGLMLIGAGCFALAIAVMLILDRIAGASDLSRLGADAAGGPAAADGGAAGTEGGRRGEGGTRIGGGSLEGLRAVFTSPYLLGVGLWVVFMAVSNTLIYFTQANVILGATDTFSQRVGSFADFDSLAQLATLLTQIFVTTHLIRKLGVGWTLAILPLVTVLGFIVLAVWPIYGVMLIFQAVHRATRYAVSRPSRETLFSVVAPAEKYKGKPIVDVFLYRGGDLAGAGIDGLFAMLGLGLAWVAMSTAPLAGMWIALSIGLGQAQARRISS